MDENDKREIIEFRLANIEKCLTKLEGLLTSSKLQDRDIDALKDSHNKLEERIAVVEERCRKIEEAPVRAKADRWGQATDILFKLSLTAAITAILVKIGLQ